MPLPTIVIQGNVCLEPSLTVTEQGRARLVIRLAAGERKKQDDGTWVDGDTTFINATLWGFAAEAAAETITKGTPVVVIGKLRQRTVEKDGAKTVYFDVDADSVAVDVKKSAQRTETDQWATNSPF